MNRRAARSRGKEPEVQRKGKKLIGKEKMYILKKTTKQERKTKGDSKKGRVSRVLSRIRTTHLRLDATSPQPRQWNLDLTNLSITKFSV